MKHDIRHDLIQRRVLFDKVHFGRLVKNVLRVVKIDSEYHMIDLKNL